MQGEIPVQASRRGYERWAVILLWIAGIDPQTACVGMRGGLLSNQK
jgi:hypothetical protein